MRLLPTAAALLILLLSATDTKARDNALPSEDPSAGSKEAGDAFRRSGLRVEEIVVRARKRDELLEDTPVSVTALSETTLMEIGATRLDDIQALVPNLTTSTADGGVAADIRIPRRTSICWMSLPVDGLRVNGSVGLLGTEYDDFPNAVSDLDSSEIDRSGESFDNAPEVQTHLGLQYSREITFGGPEWMQGWLTPRLDWCYQSEVHLRGPEVEASVQRGYNLLHARLSYTFNDDRTQIALWSKNLTDEEYFDSVTPIISSFGVAVRLYRPPRTFGGEISHRFN
jgi:outer membrane receptor for monomeric catechols